MNRPLRLAFLGDIHGNLPALEAVLDDIDRHAPDAVFLLGDLINRCPWTLEVLEVLRARKWLSVQGNHDLVLALLHTPEGWPQFNDKNRFPNVHWTWEQLCPQDISYLLNLPHDLLIEIEGAPRLRLFHGLPGDPFAGIMPDADEQAVSSQIAIYDEPILICGHTHQPLNRTIAGLPHASHNALAQPGLQRILNPGSVGMPYNGVPAPTICSWTLSRRTAIWTGSRVFNSWNMITSGLPALSARAVCWRLAGPLASSIYVRSKTGCHGPATTASGCETNHSRCEATRKLRSICIFRPTDPASGLLAAELSVLPRRL